MWARRALNGDTDYQRYCRMFPDRVLPDAHEQTMTPVFPDEHPGSFTYRNRLKNDGRMDLERRATTV
ncbi:MAG: hypothetical protein ABF297_03675 [Thiogranum sp.]